MVTLFTSLPDLSVVFFSLLFVCFCCVCLVLFSLVAAAFLVNKDVYNQEVLDMVDENRSLMNTIRQRQKHWLGHVLRSESLLRILQS